MDRRGFLRGAFSGVTSAGLLVAASPADLALFAAPLKRDDPVVLDVLPPVAPTIASGEHLYNARGELVAMVTEVTWIRPRIEVTSVFDDSRAFIQGLPEVEIRAVGVGRVDVRGDRLELRGVSPIESLRRKIEAGGKEPR